MGKFRIAKVKVRGKTFYYSVGRKRTGPTFTTRRKAINDGKRNAY